MTDAHIAAEIGEIFSGRVAGRTSHDEITVYKSLGHAVQDIAALAYAYRKRIATSAPGATASIS